MGKYFLFASKPNSPIRAVTLENGHYGTYGKRTHRSECAFSSSDQYLLCPFIDSLDTEYIDEWSRRYLICAKRAGCSDSSLVMS